jgi:hemerythrin
MERLEWDQGLLIGIEKIDAQHRKLFELANLFFESLAMTKGPDLGQSVLRGLVAYVRTHFADEEDAMRRMGYPELAAHLDQHKALTAHVYDLAKRWDDGQPIDTDALCRFLRQWLSEHIGIEDKKIGTFYNAQNTSVSAESTPNTI